MVADLGFLGGGQLARMSIQAAQRLGISCLSLDAELVTPAAGVAANITGSLSDPIALASLIRSANKITLENEFIPAKALQEAFRIADRSPDDLIPGIDCLATIQDKLLQRRALASHGVPTPLAVEIGADPAEAIANISFPMVLKARFGGYDGKGTRIARDEVELEGLRNLWGDGGWLAETFVPFRRELSAMVVRTPNQLLMLEVMETQQKDYVCDVTYPARLWDQEIETNGVPESAVAAVGGFGIFGVELFELEDGSLQVNEIAPRPHNTGHYSLDWGDLSQFDLHVRAALNLPIPQPSDGRLRGLPVYMANLLGQPEANNFRKGIAAAVELEPSARIHWYGKKLSRPGRKMGHLNIVARHEEPPHAMLPHLERVRAAFYAGWQSG